MHVVSVSAVTKSFEGRTLFADVGFGLSTDDRVGVIGPNGSGKSTLLRIVAGLEPPDAGEVVTARAARIVMLAQEPRFPPERTALATVLDHPDQGVREHEAEALLDRLGIDASAAVGALSGGQRRRVALARALAPASDLLVLDEPTNHLDVDTIDWLESELSRRNTGLLLVTHDRYLLERLSNRMLEIDPLAGRPDAAGEIHWHEGSYSDVLEARAVRAERRHKDERRRQNLLRKEIAWLRRGPKARTSKPRFRLEQAQALAAVPLEAEPVQLDLGTGRRRLGSHVLDLEGITAGYGGVPVLDGLDLSIGPGERVGIVGPNGSGKTTLLRVLTGRLQPDAGEVRIGSTVEMGVFEQEATVPPDGRRVIDTVLDVGTHLPLADGRIVSAERLAERFGFDGTLQQAEVRRLSGGERRRLALLHMLIRAPNVLVLDEPTNDLDLDTLAVLEDHLDGFRGTVIVASHDRYLLDRLTDQLYAIEDGRLRGFLDWEAYREAHAASAIARTGVDAAGDGARSDSAERNRRRQQQRKAVRSLEDRMARLGESRDRLHAELAAAGADHERAAALVRDLREVEAELATVEDEWLTLTID